MALTPTLSRNRERGSEAERGPDLERCRIRRGVSPGSCSCASCAVSVVEERDTVAVALSVPHGSVY
jgi:hypothetical protein